ncbi:OLC1v1022702C1 [Oldenlandia corymbosa var. corymbosa]|uniref:OLC1v1022702C1 n=1 Tax=Oldenlandia corymbosa var. corymbosa TaxID=529605 RepID=A0AAV1C199_OLDCO|nr:OLC1v1022702C1 [Oldenlandia corymbosa var. corymbosa]
MREGRIKESKTPSGPFPLGAREFAKVPKFSKNRYMVDIDVQIPSAFDPFAGIDDETVAPGAKEYVHIRVQQRNGKKCVTTIQGLDKKLSFEKILKALKKEFCCNGNVVVDKELGKVIQLQGDQRKNASQFLINDGLVKKDLIKIHGF